MQPDAMTALRLTYEELGNRIGRSTEAARGLDRRQRWRVEKGNDGKARVIVDEGDLTGWQPDVHLVIHPAGRVDDGRTDRVDRPDADELQALRAECDRLLEALMVSRERAAGAEGKLAKADEASAALRELVDELKAQVARERARRHEIEARVLRPWWRKLIGR
jgi:hypothetical protein